MGTTVERMQLLENGSELSITPSLTRNVDNILGPDEFEHGEVSGMLHQINLHARRKAFTVYPTDNSPKVLCTIGEALRREAVAAVDQYVTVFGQLKYSHGVDAPHEMCVESIEIHRPEESATTLGSLRGIAPDATGSLNSEDFVRNLRHGW